jgi:hypothetical protein
MNIFKKSTFLALALCVSTAHIKTTQCHGVPCNFVGVLWGVMAFTATMFGISAICRACTWSDNDVIEWIDKGLTDIQMKYSQIRFNSTSNLSQELIIFGRQNGAMYNFWRSDLERIAVEYRSLTPIHNAEIIIKDDLKMLQKYRDNIYSYNLTRYPLARQQLDAINHYQTLLETLQRGILGCATYSEEERVLHEKLHNLRQESLAKERNDALHTQNHLQKENNKIQNQKLNKTDVTIINNIDVY